MDIVLLHDFTRTADDMRTNRFLLLVLLIICSFLTACDSNDEEEGDSIIGVWESRGIDVFYYVVSEDEIAIYDYFGDDFDNLGDCYFIDTATVVRLTGSTISFRDGEEEFILNYRFEDDGDVLVLSEVDEQTGVEFSVRLDRSTRSESDFTPECDFGGAASKHSDRLIGAADVNR